MNRIEGERSILVRWGTTLTAYIRSTPISFKISAVLVLISLPLAFYLRRAGNEPVSTWAYVLLSFWAIVPPLWFLFEFSTEFPADKRYDADKADRLKNLHDLSRNIWVAFLIVLAAIMGVKWPVE